MDTICALSSPPGRSAIALIRVSGPKTREILSHFLGKVPSPRQIEFGIFRDADGRAVDELLYTFFEAPHSYTGEDLAELNCHGNPIIVEKIIGSIVSRETRRAEAGEFTRRALTNGKMDIADVEALDWILNSKSSEGVSRGLRAKLNKLSTSVSQIKSQILDLLTLTQSQLDFSEQETGELDQKTIILRIQKLRESLGSWVLAFKNSRQYLESWNIVLLGRPNSGKSSLFNALAGKNKAIVFDQPGTTRDSLETLVEIDGRQLQIVDTAGVRESDDPIETLGIEMSMKSAGRADRILWLSEAAEEPSRELMKRFEGAEWILVQTKSDLGKTTKPGWHSCSSKTGEGLESLKSLLLPAPGSAIHEEFVPLTSDRQRILVERAIENLQLAETELIAGQYLDFVTERILAAQREIGGLVDRIDNEELLREIFGRFCIGK